MNAWGHRKTEQYVLKIFEWKVIESPETCEADYRKKFIHSMLISVLKGQVVSCKDESSDHRWSFRKTIIQTEAALDAFNTVVEAMVTNTAVLEPISKLTSKATRNWVSKTTRSSDHSFSPPPQAGSVLTPEKGWRDSKTKKKGTGRINPQNLPSKPSSRVEWSFEESLEKHLSYQVF